VWFEVWGKTNGLIAFGLAVVAETAFDFALDVVLLDFQPGISVLEEIYLTIPLFCGGIYRNFIAPKLPQ
jgi:hypothetical protein